MNATYAIPRIIRLLFAALLLLAPYLIVESAHSEPRDDHFKSGKRDGAWGVGAVIQQTASAGSRSGAQASRGSARPSPIVESWQDAAEAERCGTDAACVGSSARASATCVANPALGVTGAWTVERGTRTNRDTNTSQDLGYRCRDASGNPVTPEGQPIVITVTRSDFAALPVQPATAHAGPDVGYLPVGMDLIVYADAPDQTLDTTLLGTPVQVRALPIRYAWDFGDGNTLATADPGKPYPDATVTSRYEHAGWYDVTLTTTYAGQFSVNGGPWQDIDGTITVASPPVAVYSRSFESRLIDPNTAPEDEPGTAIPARTPETEGAPADHPRHRTQ